MKTRRSSGAGRWLRPAAFVVSLLVLAVLTTFVPWGLGSLSSNPHPFNSYTTSIQALQSISSENTAPMNPLCRLQLMTHGERTGEVIILVHGYTSCPQQFHELGQRFYDRGFNVLIAPMPHHGLADRMTEDLTALTSEELAAYADWVLDIAHGLGDRVVMMGISGGGVVTAWAAQNRSDLDRAVVISPAFGYKQIPTLLTTPAVNLVSIMPDSYTWWDPALKQEIQPPYAYPRYSMHGLTQISRLGFSVQVAARRSAPAAGAVVVVTNGNEPSVNNELTQQLVSNWRLHDATVTAYEFPTELKLPHDLIDPLQPDQRIDIVYPILLAFANP